MSLYLTVTEASLLQSASAIFDDFIGTPGSSNPGNFSHVPAISNHEIARLMDEDAWVVDPRSMRSLWASEVVVSWACVVHCYVAYKAGESSLSTVRRRLKTCKLLINAFRKEIPNAASEGSALGDSDRGGDHHLDVDRPLDSDNLS